MTGSPPARPVLAAPVSGFPAFVLSKLLEDSLPARVVALQQLAERGALHPDLLAELGAQWAAIREAGEQWAQWRAATDGSTAESAAAALPRSGEIDTDRAATLLGVTPNRVRQLVRSGVLPGRKVARVWLVDRPTVELRKECNGGKFR